MADDNTLWVGGLTDQVTDDHLYELFLQAGPLQKVIRPKDKDGSFRKFAFVEFSHAESVPYAIQVMDGIKLFNSHLRLKGRTGSQSESGRSDSPASRSYDSRDNSRVTPDYHRSRSYQGHPHSRPGTIRGNSMEERRGMNSLNQPFNAAAYNAPHMQPQSFEDRSISNNAVFTGPVMLPQSFDSFEERRNRLLHKQNMSLGAHAQMRGGQHNNYAQSFSGYSQQGAPQQQWYLDNY